MAAPIRLASTVPATAVSRRSHPDDRWLSVRVELVSGAPVGALWPPPGRYLSPAHGTPSPTSPQPSTPRSGGGTSTCGRPADGAFDLTSGWHVRDINRDGGAGAVDPAALVDTRHPLGDLLRAGGQFTYTVDHDIDDAGGWRHDCVVTSDEGDPLDLFDRRPDTPAPYYGWGVIPDQFGRYWLDVTDKAPPVPDHLDQHIHGADTVITVTDRRAMIIQSVR